MWHQPSVLIFDNLEKLLGTELEVLGSFYPSSTCSHAMDSTLTPSVHDNLPRPSCRLSLLRLPMTWLLTYLISSLLQQPSRNLSCTRSSAPHIFSNKSYISSPWTKMRASRFSPRSCSGDWRPQGISKLRQNNHRMLWHWRQKQRDTLPQTCKTWSRVQSTKRSSGRQATMTR
jgi:hypothetical protein